MNRASILPCKGRGTATRRVGVEGRASVRPSTILRIVPLPVPGRM
jgi:hypothetical protein